MFIQKRECRFLCNRFLLFALLFHIWSTVVVFLLMILRDSYLLMCFLLWALGILSASSNSWITYIFNIILFHFLKHLCNREEKKNSGFGENLVTYCTNIRAYSILNTFLMAILEVILAAESQVFKNVLVLCRSWWRFGFLVGSPVCSFLPL